MWRPWRWPRRGSRNAGMNGNDLGALRLAWLRATVRARLPPHVQRHPPPPAGLPTFRSRGEKVSDVLSRRPVSRLVQCSRLAWRTTRRSSDCPSRRSLSPERRSRRLSVRGGERAGDLPRDRRPSRRPRFSVDISAARIGGEPGRAHSELLTSKRCDHPAAQVQVSEVRTCVP